MCVKAFIMNEFDITKALAPLNLGKMLEGVQVQNGVVRVTLAVKREDAAALEPLRLKIETMIRALPGVTEASAVLTAHKPAPAPSPAPPSPVLPGVRAVVAVASGKGGVGKSTVAVNLAIALAQTGLAVGLLDADVYGPSLPRMLGLNRRPEVFDGKMLPLEAWGLRCMSIGFLVEEEAAMIWRGPMVTGALNQMLGQVAWGALDILLIDMPPGTGDVQLTLAQRANLAGAVIVSTPQDIALIDARRGARMFAQVNVPVLGIVENMSYFCCPACGHRSEIFGHGGAAAEAARVDVPFLGEVPLLADIRSTGDEGTPICAAAPEHEAAQAFRRIAEALVAKLDGGRPAGPRIIVD